VGELTPFAYVADLRSREFTAEEIVSSIHVGPDARKDPETMAGLRELFEKHGRTVRSSVSRKVYVPKIGTLCQYCKLQRSIFLSVAMLFKVKSGKLYLSDICMHIPGTLKVEYYYFTTAHSHCANLRH
jgi:hypothetical protein